MRSNSASPPQNGQGKSLFIATSLGLTPALVAKVRKTLNDGAGSLVLDALTATVCVHAVGLFHNAVSIGTAWQSFKRPAQKLGIAAGEAGGQISCKFAQGAVICSAFR
tara:strand:- start:625 stop:948 length:324 start_codon:yes stop_codon:yes gene_type:complete